MAGRLTTHALDLVAGRGAAGLVLIVRRLAPATQILGTFALDAKGRAVIAETAPAGQYEFSFAVADYLRDKAIALADPPFFNDIVLRFALGGDDAHCHVPLLFSPYGYSTYRGTA